MLLSNEIPKLPDESGALPSRQLVWHFKQSFYGREDLGLDKRLWAELPSILLWAIEGWQRLNSRGYFVQPKAGDGIVNQMMDIASPMGAFVNEFVEIKTGCQLPVITLFTKWCEWCEEKKRHPGDESTFGRNLRTVLPSIETDKRRGDAYSGEKPWVRFYEGLRLKTNAD
jgi:putative DNA primase/helicase